jgi:hypothetical protein
VAVAGHAENEQSLDVGHGWGGEDVLGLDDPIDGVADRVEYILRDLTTSGGDETHGIKQDGRGCRGREKFSLGHDRQNRSDIGKIGVEELLDDLGLDLKIHRLWNGGLLIVLGGLFDANEAIAGLADLESVVVARVIPLVDAGRDGGLRVEQMGGRGGPKHTAVTLFGDGGFVFVFFVFL